MTAITHVLKASKSVNIYIIQICEESKSKQDSRYTLNSREF